MSLSERREHVIWACLGTQVCTSKWPLTRSTNFNRLAWVSREFVSVPTACCKLISCAQQLQTHTPLCWRWATKVISLVSSKLIKSLSVSCLSLKRGRGEHVSFRLSGPNHDMTPFENMKVIKGSVTPMMYFKIF